MSIGFFMGYQVLLSKDILQKLEFEYFEKDRVLMVAVMAVCFCCSVFIEPDCT